MKKVILALTLVGLVLGLFVACDSQSKVGNATVYVAPDFEMPSSEKQSVIVKTDDGKYYLLRVVQSNDKYFAIITEGTKIESTNEYGFDTNKTKTDYIEKFNIKTKEFWVQNNPVEIYSYKSHFRAEVIEELGKLTGKIDFFISGRTYKVSNLMLRAL